MSKFLPMCPRKKNRSEVAWGRCFSPLPFYNKDQGTSPSNPVRQGAALPASYFSCMGWEAESATFFAGDRGGTPDATPACMLPNGELGKGHLVNTGCGPKAGTAWVNASFIKADKSSCKKQAEQVMLRCPACARAAAHPLQTPSALPSSAGRRKKHMHEREMPLHTGQ